MIANAFDINILQMAWISNCWSVKQLHTVYCNRFLLLFWHKCADISESAYSASSGFVLEHNYKRQKDLKGIFLFPTAHKEFTQFLKEALVFGPSGGVESVWKVKYISLIKLNTEQSLWVASSVTQRGKQKEC